MAGWLAAAYAGEVRARGAAGGAMLALSARLLDGGTRLRLRAGAVDAEHGTRDAAHATLMDTRADAVLVVDVHGRVLAANPAFVTLVRAAHDAQVLGRPLRDWLGRDPTLASQLVRAADAGLAPPLPTQLRTITAQQVEVELSATLLPDAEQVAIGVVLHRRQPAELLGTSRADLARRRKRIDPKLH